MINVRSWRTPDTMRLVRSLPWPDPLKDPVDDQGVLHPTLHIALETLLANAERAGLALDEGEPIQVWLGVVPETTGEVVATILATFTVPPALRAKGIRLTGAAEAQHRDN